MRITEQVPHTLEQYQVTVEAGGQEFFQGSELGFNSDSVYSTYHSVEGWGTNLTLVFHTLP